MPDRVRGAALFADVSGFTALTEALAKELGAQRGAEVLTTHLNRVFHALVEELEAYGGDVIYYSGDAVTCWIEGDDGARAAACGLAMQETMSRLGEVVTPAGSRVRLAMKVAVAAGPARRFVVGDPEIQLMDVLAGRLIDALALAERHAASGEVVLERSALASVGGRAQIRELRSNEADGSLCGVVAGVIRSDDRPAASSFGDIALQPDVAKAWLLPEVYARLATGRGEFLAELRPAFPVFVQFGGIDYDEDEQAIGKLDALVRQVQRIVTAYGGNLLQLTLGDKGAYLYAVFGSPIAHEDDAARAAHAALELRVLPTVSAATDVKIGLAHGRLYSGTYGHERRLAFTCLGDAVNLAARLMSEAPPGGIYVAESVHASTGDAFMWEALPAIAVKGKAEPVRAYALVEAARGAARAAASESTAMVGRAAELAAMTVRLDEALAGRGAIIALSGEAGIGKSRLVAELVAIARQRGAVVAAGECQSYGRSASYLVWREIWATLLRIDRRRSEEEQVRALESELAAIDPMLVARAPLLAGLVDLPLPDNDLTAQFDAKLRKTSLEGLLGECLRARAAETPLVLVLEDCHWLDPLSRDLLGVLARMSAALPVLMLLAYRPLAEAATLGVEQLANCSPMALTELADGDVAQLVRSRLGDRLAAGAEPPGALSRLIAARAQGNPFYVEELLNFIADHGVDARDERALKGLELPESLHSLVLSRIDRLGEGPRQVLKVASVVGREFTMAMLPGAYRELGDSRVIAEHLDALSAHDLVHKQDPEGSVYLFKHVVTREVAYESMPFAFRSMLHERVGNYIEDVEGDAVERHLDLLAHHFWHSENLAKKREYLGRAGAAAQIAYANAAAIDYFERLAPLLSKGSRLDVLLKLGKVLEVVGDWQRAEAVDAEALALAEGLDDGLRRASCQTALAEVARKQGRYAEALDLLNRATRGFAAFGDDAGVARVLHLVGTVMAQRGDYDKAEQSYKKSLQMRERIGDKAGIASLLSNLGVVAEYRGEYGNSKTFHERALALRESVGDLGTISVSMSNLGMVAALQKQYEVARDWFEKAMRLNRQIGDAWLVAAGHNNLGNAMRGLGDYVQARSHYGESLRAYHAYDDRWSLAFLLEDIGMLAGAEGNAAAALELVGAADSVRAAIGAPRSPSLQTELEQQLADAAASLTDEDRADCRERGRALSLGDAVARALGLCGEETRRVQPTAATV